MLSFLFAIAIIAAGIMYYAYVTAAELAKEVQNAARKSPELWEKYQKAMSQTSEMLLGSVDKLPDHFAEKFELAKRHFDHIKKILSKLTNTDYLRSDYPKFLRFTTAIYFIYKTRDTLRELQSSMTDHIGYLESLIDEFNQYCLLQKDLQELPAKIKKAFAENERLIAETQAAIAKRSAGTLTDRDKKLIPMFNGYCEEYYAKTLSLNTKENFKDVQWLRKMIKKINNFKKTIDLHLGYFSYK